MTNRASQQLFGAEIVGTNMIRRFYGDPMTAASIANWSDIARAGVTRLRRQVEDSPFDATLRELLELAETAIDGDDPEPAIHDDDFVLCPHFRVDDQIVRTVGMVARFDVV